LAHTYALTGLPSSWIRTFCTLGSQRRGVARMEWLLLLPKLGFLPQITHILDMWPLVLRRIAHAGECHSMPQFYGV
jgi:hypothetical protein